MCEWSDVETWLLLMASTTVSLGRARTDAQMGQFRMFGNMFGCFTHRFKVVVRRADGSTSNYERQRNIWTFYTVIQG